MGRPGSSADAAASSGKGRGESWITATRERLEARGGGKHIGKGKGKVPPPTREWVAQRAVSFDQERSQASGVWQQEDEEGAPPTTAVSAASVIQAATEAHRFGAGVRASGFEPQRHAFYVLGRPVQVMGPV